MDLVMVQLPTFHFEWLIDHVELNQADSTNSQALHVLMGISKLVIDGSFYGFSLGQCMQII